MVDQPEIEEARKRLDATHVDVAMEYEESVKPTYVEGAKTYQKYQAHLRARKQKSGTSSSAAQADEDDPNSPKRCPFDDVQECKEEGEEDVAALAKRPPSKCQINGEGITQSLSDYLIISDPKEQVDRLLSKGTSKGLSTSSLMKPQQAPKPLSLVISHALSPQAMDSPDLDLMFSEPSKASEVITPEVTIGVPPAEVSSPWVQS
ncbi:hypothetical protein ACFE04_024628 [Oxalis oulophora]